MYNINLNYTFNKHISNVGIIFFISIILIYFGYLYSIYNGFLFKIFNKLSLIRTIYCDTPPSKQTLNAIIRGSNSDYSVTLHSKELNHENEQISKINNENNVKNDNNYFVSNEVLINMLDLLCVDTNNKGLTKLHLTFFKTITPQEICQINFDITQHNHIKIRDKYHYDFIEYLSQHLNLLNDNLINEHTKQTLLDELRLFRAKKIINNHQVLFNLTNTLYLKFNEIFSLSTTTFNSVNIYNIKNFIVNSDKKIIINNDPIKNKDGFYMKYKPLHRKINFNNVINVQKLFDLYTLENDIKINVLPGNSGIYAYQSHGLKIFFPSTQFKNNIGGWCSIFNENCIKRSFFNNQFYITRVINIANKFNFYEQAKYVDNNGELIIKHYNNIPYRSVFNENKFIYKKDTFEFLCDSGAIIRIPIPKNELKLTQFGLSKVQLLIKYFPLDPIIPGDNSSLKENLKQILKTQWNIKPKYFFYEQFKQNTGFWFNIDFLLNYNSLITNDEYIQIINYLLEDIVKQYPINKDLIKNCVELDDILNNNNIILMNNIAEIRVKNSNNNNYYTISIPFNNLNEISTKINIELIKLHNNGLDMIYLSNINKALIKFNLIVNKYL
jgi:hypothetical protein